MFYKFDFFFMQFLQVESPFLPTNRTSENNDSKAKKYKAKKYKAKKYKAKKLYRDFDGSGS